MFIELVDALRCPNTHEESWLVASATTVVERHILDGVLGCPVCRAEFPVRHGIADFRRQSARDEAPPPSSASGDGALLADGDQLAAMMDLGDALGFAVLVGRWGARAEALLELMDGPPLLLVDPPPGLIMRPGLSALRAGPVLPLAGGAARAVAVDTTAPDRVASAARITRVGGRLVAPSAAAVPEGVRELARDERVWVAVRETLPSAPITLHVRRGGEAPSAPNRLGSSG